MAHDVFISHSSKDKTAAEAICHALENSGVRCWIAPRDVAPGLEYAAEIINGIENCKIFLLILSKESNVSNPVSKEVENAFRYGKTVIPCRIEEVEIRKSLEYYLSNIHWLDAFPDDKEFDSIVEAVKSALGVESPPAPVLQTPSAQPQILSTNQGDSVMYCQNCGSPLDEGAVFCSKCGSNQSISAEQPIQQAPPVQPQMQPIYQPPIQPQVQQPMQPTYQQPVQPQVQQPMQPTYQQPVQPQVRQPAQPTYQQPVQPQVQQPMQPTYQQPVQPQVQQPMQPTYQQPVQQYTLSPQPVAAKKSWTPVFIVMGVAAAALLGIVGVKSIFFPSAKAPPAEVIVTDSPMVDKTEPMEATDAPVVQETLTSTQIFDNNKDAIFQVYIYQNGVHVGYGSGFFINAEGVAVTNHHVMNGATSATVLLYDGRELDIMGYYSYDVDNDLAIIQVDGGGKSFPYLAMGNSNAVVGEKVFAVGGPGGDPITFTDGMVSRLVKEPLSYGGETTIYTVEGLIQHTASIYGGNSGGPLLNEKGEVIGINSAERPDRESMQWAIPIDRVVMPAAGEAIKPLPIGTPVQDVWDGRITYLEQYPFIPDFLSVSRNANLQLGGTPEDLDDTGSYDYMYIYSLPKQNFETDTDEYDAVLEKNGFIYQDAVNEDGEVYVFLYNQWENVSVVYIFYSDYDMLLIYIVQGNFYQENFGGSGGSQSYTLTFTLTNNAGKGEIYELYIVPSWSDTWGDEILKDLIVYPNGGWVTITIPYNPSDNSWAIKIIDGSGEGYEWDNIDLSYVSSLVLTVSDDGKVMLTWQ